MVRISRRIYSFSRFTPSTILYLDTGEIVVPRTSVFRPKRVSDPTQMAGTVQHCRFGDDAMARRKRPAVRLSPAEGPPGHQMLTAVRRVFSCDDWRI